MIEGEIQVFLDSDHFVKKHSVSNAKTFSRMTFLLSGIVLIVPMM